MSKTIEISRDMAEILTQFIDPRITDSAALYTIRSQQLNAIDHVRQALAAPVVERQEPVGYVSPDTLESVRERAERMGQAEFHVMTRSYGRATIALYTSPPAPVAVVQERWEFEKFIRREWPDAPLRYVRDALPEDDPRYGEYCDESLQRAWVGWQARACLDKVKELN